MPRELNPLARTVRVPVATLVILLAIGVLPRPAYAACTITSTGVNFGTYDVFTASPDDSTGTITYRCGTDTHIRVTLSTGTAGTYSTRQMANGGGDTLGYNLFTNATRTNIWGDGSGATDVYSRNNPPNNQDVVLTIYGRIPASQDVSVGSYSDTIIATIEF